MWAEGAGRPGAARTPEGADVGPEPEIRTAEPGDLRRIVEIEECSFPAPWSERTFRRLLGRTDTLVLVAERRRRSGAGERVAGFAVAWFAWERMELGDLAVAPDDRRRGVATALVRAVQRAARDRGVAGIRLQVREGNSAALELYRKCGFRRVGRRSAYYPSPREDALVLRWGPEGPSR